MQKYEDYKIITESNKQEFTDEINRVLRCGYTLIGDMYTIKEICNLAKNSNSSESRVYIVSYNQQIAKEIEYKTVPLKDYEKLEHYNNIDEAYSEVKKQSNEFYTEVLQMKDEIKQLKKYGEHYKNYSNELSIIISKSSDKIEIENINLH